MRDTFTIIETMQCSWSLVNLAILVGSSMLGLPAGTFSPKISDLPSRVVLVARIPRGAGFKNLRPEKSSQIALALTSALPWLRAIKAISDGVRA